MIEWRKKVNVQATDIIMGLIGMFGVIFYGALSPNLFLRDWIYASAFHNKSSKLVRRIKQQKTRWQRVNLWYTTKYKYPLTTKRRVIVYWVYWIYVLSIALQMPFVATGIITDNTIQADMLAMLLALIVVISMLHSIQKSRKK